MTDAFAIQEGRADRTGAFQDPRFRGGWSGMERDCLFFNARGPKFYDAGHAFALDFPDDGRAVAPVDIDGDGDLDLAILCLEGLRLMENRSAPRRFARVRLEAAKGDRQALGARVRLEAGGVTQQDYVKATTGFATQVPLDLHFGLAAAEKIDAITIRWPDGSTETHRDLPVDRLLVIRQGSFPKAQELPRWSDATRPRVEGAVKRPESLAGAGAKVLVVHMGDSASPKVDESRAQIHLVTPDSQLLRELHGSSPSTFVFDPEGRLRRAFYRPVEDREIAAVVDHLGRGKFHSDLVSVATYHLSRHEYDAADKALTRALEIEPKFAIGLYYLGHLRGFQNRHAEAVEAFRSAVNIDPCYREARHNLGVALYKSRKLPEAASELREALKLRDGAETRHVLGQVLAESGKLDEAVAEIRRSLELDPK
ncbi:MAG TPA: ASPIC/UnbV domain-containing protein, partial [Planctomycetota bacterium]